MKTAFPDHRWSIPDPLRWKHIERVPTRRLLDTLREIETARESIQAAQNQLELEITVKQQAILAVWTTAFTQLMKQYEGELASFAKESARLDRLIKKCSEREGYLASVLEQLKVQVT